MTDSIKQKALALVNEAAKGVIYYELDDLDDLERVYFTEALCRAIEQHEAFRQEVSEALLRYHALSHVPHGLQAFIIAKPDPLVEAVGECDDGTWETKAEYAQRLRAAIEKRGGKIVWGEE